MDNNDTRSIPDLIAERKALARQAAEINTKLEVIDRALFARLESALDAFGVRPQATLFPDPPPPAPIAPPWVKPANTLVPPPPAPQAPKANEGTQIIMRGVREILASGRPMKIREIYDALMARNIKIPGKVPMNNLSAHMSRSKEFALVSGNRWTLA
ncbi:hypothetical protein [Arenimonas composti]|uniref:HTH HARE-type domain-containing protein n=1 Tax=Arenimonas composti TR7-09 = DSM 18010 TaxID=1121013 RepID=A0A091BCJ3_9GAMM|nr:hypothetical protein [Arenimonas composti]KFN49257.1 hypothetical protein P873_11455 [Arenimonas composti TR7-09 = DSM 18010]